MKINKLLKNTIVTSLCFGSLIIMGSGDSKAVLQSNGNTGATYNLSDWMMNVRKMEQLGGAMGLSETLNTNLTSSSGSNNIDVHMEKNTEYGALAILSASSYGNPNKINDGDTTTGNVTGVVMNINKEWVAVGTVSDAPNYANASLRYKNLQTKTYAKQIGDAITETAGWHGSGVQSWINNYYDGSYRANDPLRTNGIVRASSGSIFSYDGLYAYWESGWAGNTKNNKGIARWSYAYCSRAVVVSGQGL